MYNGGREYGLDCSRNIQWFIHRGVKLLDVMEGRVTGTELSQFVSSARQTDNEVSVTLSWHMELYGEAQPKIGDIIELYLEGTSYWIGFIRQINEYRLQSGEKSMTIVGRTRDAGPAWREVHRTTPIYVIATPLLYIAKQIAYTLGLSDAEIGLPDTGSYTVHTSTQMADITAWQMLTTLYQPSGYEPYIDCRGRLRVLNRDITKGPDIIYTDNRRLISVNGSKSIPSTTEVRIKWLDPNLTEVAQQARQLDTKNITAGFFQLKQQQDIVFSPDGTQRARNTYMVVKQSANSGLIPVCSEDYDQLTPSTGKITLRTYAWVPVLATAYIIAKLAASSTPDGVASYGGGVTIPIGRRIEAAADIFIFLTMMSIGTGVYEIWGTPYDYVHTRNTTTAYNKNANIEDIKITEIENDFVPNQAASEAMAVRELLYICKSAFSYSIKIVDDTRVERGDIIQLVDGSKIFVDSFSRDLSPGKPAALDINGFKI